MRTPNPERVIGLGYQPKMLKDTSTCLSTDLVKSEGEPMPDVNVPALMVAPNIPLEELMTQLITTNKLPMQPAISSRLKNLRVGDSLMGISAGGKLQDVIEELSQAMGFFYRLDKGRLVISPTRSFQLALPPDLKYAEGFAAMLKEMGAEDIYLNPRSMRVAFNATRTVTKNVQREIDSWPETMAQVAIEVSVYQVSLASGSAMGINWQNLSLTNGIKSVALSGGAGAVAGGLTAAVGWNFGNAIQLSAVVQAMSAQGATKVLQQPKLAVYSGEEAILDATTTKRFAVPTSTTTATTGTTTGNGTTTTTPGGTVGAVSIQEQKLGLTAKIRPFVRNSTVTTEIELNMTELDNQRTQKINGNEFPLFDTRDTHSKAKLNIRDGDMIVLSGIMMSRSSSSSQGLVLPFIGKVFDYANSEQAERSELVIVMRPRVLRYQPDDSACR